jgi:hypothetical protein
MTEALIRSKKGNQSGLKSFLKAGQSTYFFARCFICTHRLCNVRRRIERSGLAFGFGCFFYVVQFGSAQPLAGKRY